MLEYIFKSNIKISPIYIYILLMFLGIILMLTSCEKTSYLPAITNLTGTSSKLLNGTWTEKKFPQNKMIVTDSTITQIGFPLVAGDDIKRKEFKCNYRGVIFNQPRDSFKLKIIELSGDVLNLEIDNYYGTRDKIFIR